MLEFMRNKAKSPFIQAIVVIIILVFVFWGVGTNQGGSGDVAATVNDQNISVREYQRGYDQLVNQYRDQFGGQLPPNLFEALGIREMALEQLIEEKLIRQGAREMGITVSEEEVRRTIYEMEVFRTAIGFDINRYREVLSASRMPAGDFEASIREDLLMRKVMSFLGDFGRVSEQEIQELFEYEFEAVNLEYLALAADDFQGKVPLDEEQLGAYFEKNKDRYQTPPLVKVQYVSFPLVLAAGDIEVSAEEIETYYHQNIDQFKMKESRRARHILINTAAGESAEEVARKRQQLEELLAKVKNGEDFSALARKHSEDGSAAGGGDLGFFERGQMVQSFEEAAFRLAAGETSGVIETPFGLHLIKLEEIKPASTKSLEEMQESIAATLHQEKVGTAAFRKASQGYEQIILSGSLQKYAEQQESVSLRETEYFARQAPPEEFAANPSFLQAAFNLRAGELSSLITGEQSYAIIFVEDVKAPEIPALAEVREEVQADFLTERGRTLAQETARAILADAQQGAGLADKARELGLEIQETGFLSRRQLGDTSLPERVTQEGLTLGEARPYPEDVVESGRTFYILRFKEKRAPAASLYTANKEELRQELLQQNQLALLSGWLENLKQQAKITRNERLFL
jgi:peptidyl-prolyl cis-trans isomerase D